MNSCTICDKEVKLIYNNTFEDMKIFNCTNCEVSYIVTPNKVTEKVHEFKSLKLILDDPFYINFIDQLSFHELAMKYIEL